MTLWSILVVGAFLVAFARGVRATIRLAERWRATDLRPRSSILWAFVVVAATITLVAGWVGFLSVRRVLGFTALDGTAVVTAVLAVGLFFIPDFLLRVVDRIEQGRA